MLGNVSTRLLTEFGPWLWMFAGLFFVFLEIFIPRGIALSLGLAAILTGTLAVLGSSGVMPNTGLEAQIGILMLIFLILMALFKGQLKKN